MQRKGEYGVNKLLVFYAAFGMSVGETPFATCTHNGQTLGISSGNGGLSDDFNGADAMKNKKSLAGSCAGRLRKQ